MNKHYSWPKEMEREAANFLALRDDRGLTPSEQKAFAAWLAADPRHAAAAAELEAAWQYFDKIKVYPRPSAVHSNPDFFARTRKFPLTIPVAFAAAAAIVFGAILWRSFSPAANPDGAHRFASASAVQQVRLSDGSMMELNSGSEVVEQFTTSERRILLLHGEVNFIVTKNPARPFVVCANGVNVRAVGTAFNVRLETTTVNVLVTEGKVQVEREPAAATAVAASLRLPGWTEIPLLTANENAVIPLVRGAGSPPLTVRTLSPEAIDQALAWQTDRVFEDSPLETVVTRFNRKNAVSIVVADQDLAALRISGRFRTDDMESFLQLLEASFGVEVERRTDGTIILHGPRKQS